MTIARQSSKAVVSAAVTFFFIISSVRLNACMARLWFRVMKRLLLQILIEPFDGELDRMLARRAVDAVVRDARDQDVLLRLRGALVGEFTVILDVEEFFLLGVYEERRAVFESGGVFDRRVKQQLVPNRRANQIADHAHLARRRIAEFAARATCSLVIGELQLIGLASRQRGYRRRSRVERGHLADNRFYARVTRGDVNDVSARIARTAQADAGRIHHRLAHPPVNGVEPAGDEFQRVNYLAHFYHIGAELLRLSGDGLDRRSPGQDQPRVALAPTPIVEGQDQIPRIREVNRIPAKARRRAAPTVRLDDGRELFARERFEREEFAMHAHAFAHDIDPAVINIVGRFETGRRRLLLRRRVRRTLRIALLSQQSLRAKQDGATETKRNRDDEFAIKQNLPPFFLS